MGGLKINADAEILDTQGNVIPGLYAAGETTGGTQSAGPYELRLPIFLQPLGGALKNRSAARSLASLFPPQADGLRHPASAAPCLRIAGRGPNNSSLLPPLAALVVVAVGCRCCSNPP